MDDTTKESTKRLMQNKTVFYPTLKLFIALVACLAADSMLGSLQAQAASFDRVEQFNSVYHVERTVPVGFTAIEEFACVILDTSWDKRRDLGGRWVKSRQRIGLCGTLLQSDDRHCALLFNDIIDMQFYRRPDIATFRDAYTEQRWGHRGEILAILMAQLGTADFRYEELVSVVAGREARRRFGADSIFTFEVPIEPQELAGETYTRCVMLYLSRKDRAYLGFTFLFTDEGYERRAEYLRALDGAVRYKRGRWKKPEWIRRQKEN